MTFDDVKRHFGSVAKAQLALGIRARQTIYNWRKTGIPEGAQCRIQIRTGGALKAEEKKRKNGHRKAA